MMFIIAMSGLVGFVAGLRVRLVSLIVLAAIVTACSGGAATAMALPFWQIVLSVILSVTAFELAAFASMAVYHGRVQSVPAKAPVAAASPVRSGPATAR